MPNKPKELKKKSKTTIKPHVNTKKILHRINSVKGEMQKVAVDTKLADSVQELSISPNNPTFQALFFVILNTLENINNARVPKVTEPNVVVRNTVCDIPESIQTPYNMFKSSKEEETDTLVTELEKLCVNQKSELN